uniref:CLAVATA3/ESR (CLE)-related protein 12-like n=1 Tax=Cucumis melo TaxID=3656 RepID=A0A9I9CL69_CUCME
MTLKISHFLFTMLWISLLLLLLHELNIFKAKMNHKPTPTITFSYYSSSSNHPLITRKVLTSKVDFTSFFPHRRPNQPRKHSHPTDTDAVDKPAPSDIDPRYGVEKRRVPTGPNPLHH